MNLLHGSLAPDGTGFAFTPRASDGPAWSLRLDEQRSKRVAAAAARQVVLGIRPEDILPTESAGTDPSLEGTVEMIQDLGAERHVHLRVGGQPLVARFAATYSADLRQKVSVTIKPESVHVFDAATGQAIT
jgi:ABC-type sugar transport system ATPase subunit